MNNRTASDEQIRSFLERFENGWRESRPDTLLGLLHPTVELRQPFFPRCCGRDSAARWLERVQRSVPDLNVKVYCWAQAQSSLFIEFELFSEVLALRMPMVDRFDLRGEMAFRRLTYMALPLIIGNAIRHPRHWSIMRQAGGTLKSTFAGTGGTLPGPITAANDQVEFIELQRAGILPPAWGRVVFCRPRHGGAPTRQYVASPFAALFAYSKPLIQARKNHYDSVSC